MQGEKDQLADLANSSYLVSFQLFAGKLIFFYTHCTLACRIIIGMEIYLTTN